MGYAIYKAIAGIGAVGASKIAEKKIEKKTQRDQKRHIENTKLSDKKPE